MRNELLKALNQQRYVAPNGGGPTLEDLYKAIEDGRADNVEKVLGPITVRIADEPWVEWACWWEGGR